MCLSHCTHYQVALVLPEPFGHHTPSQSKPEIGEMVPEATERHMHVLRSLDAAPVSALPRQHSNLLIVPWITSWQCNHW